MSAISDVLKTIRVMTDVFSNRNIHIRFANGVCATNGSVLWINAGDPNNPIWKESVLSKVAHEAGGHIAHTDFSFLNSALRDKSSTFCSLNNIIEDVRIEMKCMDVFGGAYSILQRMTYLLFKEGYWTSVTENTPLENLLFAWLLYSGRGLGVDGQEHLHIEGQKAREILETLHGIRSPIYNQIEKRMKKWGELSTTRDAFYETQKIYALLKKLSGEEPQQPQAGQSGESDESGSESGQSGESDESGSESGQSGESGESGSESGQSGESGESGSESGQSGESGESGSESGQSGESGESGSESGQSGESDESGSESGQSGESGESGSESGQSGESDESGSESGQSGESGESGNESGQSGMPCDDLGESGKGAGAGAEECQNALDANFDGLGDCYLDFDELMNQIINRQAKETPMNDDDMVALNTPLSLTAVSVPTPLVRKANQLSRGIKRTIESQLWAKESQPITYDDSGLDFDDQLLGGVLAGNNRIFYHEDIVESHKSSVLIALDTSGSMGSMANARECFYEVALTAALSILQALEELDVNCSMITFSNDVYIAKRWEQQLNQAITSMYGGYGGGTATNLALRHSASLFNMLDAPTDRKQIILITDGQPNNRSQVENVCEELKADGFDVASIQIQLPQYAGVDNFNSIDDIEDLNEVLENIVRDGLLSAITIV